MTVFSTAFSRRVVIVAATLATFGIGGVAANAALLPYIYTPLDASGLFLSSGRGATNGAVVGYGAGIATDNQYRAFSWDVATGVRTLLDDAGQTRTYVFGATNGFAAGYQSNNVTGNDAALWNVATGTRTVLPRPAQGAFTYATGANAGAATGYMETGGATYAAAWDIAGTSSIALDNSGFYTSQAKGADSGFVYGYSVANLFNGQDKTAYTPWAWNRTTGARSALSLSGLAGAVVTGAGGGYVTGYGYDSQFATTAQATVWDTFSGTRLALDTTNLAGSNALYSWNNIVFGEGTPTGSLASRPVAWDINTGARYDLQTLIFPAGAQNPIVSGVDEATGTLTGSLNEDAVAFTVFGDTGARTVGDGQTVTAPTVYEHQSGTNTVNGTFTFANPADNDYRLLGGTLNGRGTIGGDLLNIGGTVAPGNSPGTLTVTGDFSQGAGGILTLETDGVTNDLLSVGGSATLGGSLVVNALTGYTPQVGDSFYVLNAPNGITGTFSSISPGWAFQTQFGGTAGFVSYLGAAVVPEAGTGILFLGAGLSVLGTGLVRRKR